MIIPDANLLLFAYDSDSPFHDKAAAWWTSCMNGDETIGLCEVVVYAFIRIGTNPRAFAKPLTIGEACEIVDSWLKQPPSEPLFGNASDLSQAMHLLQSAGTGGNLTTDAQIAAISLRHKAVVHTADTDFGRFAEVKWSNPISSSKP